MPVFRLKKDELYKQWYRGYYEIEADTLKEAVQMIKDQQIEPYDAEPIFELIQEEPLITEILNEFGETIYSSEDDSRQL